MIKLLCMSNRFLREARESRHFVQIKIYQMNLGMLLEIGEDRKGRRELLE